MNKEQKRLSLSKASSNPKRKYSLNIIKLNFDNLFIKCNYKQYLGLHQYNTKWVSSNLIIMKYTNSHKIVRLYKAISYLRRRSLRIDILERVPMIICTFMETFICAFMSCFPMKKKTGNLIFGLIFDFFFKLYGWRHFAVKNFQYSIPLSHLEQYLGVCLIPN